jgi:hypothetical protein
MVLLTLLLICCFSTLFLSSLVYSISLRIPYMVRARGSVVGWGTMLQVGRSLVRVPMRWIFFNLLNPSSRNMALGSTQPLTEMSTRNLPGVKRRPARKAWLPHRHLWAGCLENVGASTSHSPMRLHGLLQRLLYRFTLIPSMIGSNFSI